MGLRSRDADEFAAGHAEAKIEEQEAEIKRLKHDIGQLEQHIEEQDVEVQQQRANLGNARAAMAEVQAENKQLRETLTQCRQALERGHREEFLPPCELKCMERGVYEELVDDGKRIERKPTNELRLLLRQPFEGEVIEGHKYVLKVIPVWVPR